MGFIDSSARFVTDNSDGISAVGTAFIAFFTIISACATIRIYRHSAVSERAYIEISHSGPPGLEINELTGTAKVQVTATNRGRTPARVTNMFLALVFDQLPTKPDYTLPANHGGARAFLVTGSKVRYNRTFTADQHDLMAAKLDQKPLWLYGYVDYIDIFGKRHRAGYMRRHCPFDYTHPDSIPGQPVERKNNLIFESTPGYNYDRRRRRGEGQDWGEKD